MLKVGQKVRFIGREIELGKYHRDYAQLIGQVGIISEAYADFAPYPYTVVFHEFPDSTNSREYPCRADELQAL